jgi:hypothetical protein
MISACRRDVPPGRDKADAAAQGDHFSLETGARALRFVSHC